MSDANLYKIAKEDFWCWSEEIKSSINENSEMSGDKGTLAAKMDKLQVCCQLSIFCVTNLKQSNVLSHFSQSNM